jgi:hypothetical protein
LDSGDGYLIYPEGIRYFISYPEGKEYLIIFVEQNEGSIGKKY